MDTNIDRSWIKNQHGADYRKGIQGFMKQASNHLDKKGRTSCPCTKCTNIEHRHIDDVRRHLVEFGMEKDYTRWKYHGEPEVHSDDSDDEDDDVDPDDVEEDEESKQEREELFNNLVSVRDYMDRGLLHGESSSTQKENPKSKILNEVQQPLYPGAKHAKLDFLVKMLHIKVNNGLSDEAFDDCLELVKDLMPKGETVPKTYAEAKAIIEEVKSSQDKGSE